MKFAKGGEQTFSTEIFLVSKVKERRPRPVYELEDLNETLIEGQFYAEELTPVRISKETSYKIDKILYKRVRRGKFTVRILTLGSRHLVSRISDMTSLDRNNFYVTLLTNASRDIYDQNTHADFTVKLAQPIDLGTISKWEVGVCEITCS